MSALDTGVVVDRVPTTNCWEYGGHPYALEPLALPPLRPPRRTLDDPAPIMALSKRLRQLDSDDSGSSLPRPRRGDAELDRLFWFRWVTGHQITFAIWQLLAGVVDEANTPEADLERIAHDARPLVAGYTGMLLYTGSPTREIYEQVIRAPLARQHVSMSGAWARDYGPIRPLLRGRVELGSGTQAKTLRSECLLVEQVHEGIALKLVPSGVSLMQENGARRGTWQMPRKALCCLYDNVFLTHRMPVTYEAVVRQLIRRIHAVILDINTNGLDPLSGSGGREDPDQLSTHEVVERKQSLVQDLSELIVQTGQGGATPCR
ncbi:L-tyrosine 3-hydroxylase [Streptomyces prasinus]|uniref:L-tyrosine 3-hydroxylase n=2 Tax=Streptomyces prasinus TaxID=67345 RepID=A0ABX6ASK9_9ACTN|nr:L-tyrosine 3-hydroxylase [Streptomyces prasinus]